MVTLYLICIILLSSFPYLEGICLTNHTTGTRDFKFCCCKYIDLSTPTITASSSTNYITTTSSSYESSSLEMSFISTTTYDLTTTAQLSTISTVNIVETSTIEIGESISYLSSVYPTSVFSSIAELSSSIQPSLSSNTPSTSSSTTSTPSNSASIGGKFFMAPSSSGDGSKSCFTEIINSTYKRQCDCVQNFDSDITTNTSYSSFTCFNVSRPSLYIAGFFNLDTKAGQSLLTAAKIAVEEINESDQYFPDYNFILLANVSSSATHHIGSGMLLDYLNENPTKIMILGPGDNNIAKTVASIAGLNQYRITQVSYGTTDLELSEQHGSYPYFFRTNPLQTTYNDARIAILEQFQWRTVALLYSTDPYYSQLHSQLAASLRAKGFIIVAEEGFVGNPRAALQNMKIRDAHIILGTFNGSLSSSVFCEAYLAEMYGPQFVWLLLDIQPIYTSTICTLEQLNCAAYGQLFFRFKTKQDGKLISGKTASEFLEDFHHRVSNNNNISNSNNTDAMHTYEAVWTIANALKLVENKLSKEKLLDFKYGNNTMNELIRKETAQTQFFGPTGVVRFATNGNRGQTVYIYQRSYGGSFSNRGYYDNGTTPPLMVSDLSWPGGEPFRPTTVETTWRYISVGLYVFYCILAAFGIIFALFCMVVIIWKRKERIIQWSFPTLSVIVIIGCILVYISVFLFGVDNIISSVTTVDQICRARLWVFSIGFILAVGGILAKLWIAYHVFNKRYLMRKKRRRSTMLTIILVLFVINLIILMCWHFINPHQRTVHYIREQEKYECDLTVMQINPFLIKETAIEQCTCGNSFVWYTLMAIWKFLLLFIGVLMALQTRGVFIGVINDTQRCGFCIYIIAIGFAIGCLLALITRLYPNIFFGLVGLIILICVTAVLLILYLHKVLTVLRNRRGRIMVKGNNHKSSTTDRLSTCCCCSCVKRCCPRCFALCCLPLIGCLGAAFACCGKCCAKCCGDGKHGSHDNETNEEMFIVNGVGNDKDRELSRLQRELNERDMYLNKVKGGKSKCHPIATQTEGDNDNNHDYAQKYDQRYENNALHVEEIDDDIEERAKPKIVMLSIPQSNGSKESKKNGNELDPSRYNYGTKKNTVQIYQKKQDWSHVGSKLKASGALKAATPTPYDQVRSSLEDRNTNNSPLTGQEHVKSDGLESPRSQGFRPMPEKRIVNGPPVPLELTKRTNQSSPGDDSRSLTNTPNNPHDGTLKRNNVNIFNSPTDYSNIKSRLGNAPSKGTPNVDRKGGVKILNKPVDYSHIKSTIPK